MRQFKLRQEKSFIKVLKEPPNQKKKVNYSRLVYIGIFLVVLFFFLKRVYNANMIIFANGQIELPKQKVTFSNDIKLLNLWVQEGDEVCTGDTLFSYLIIGDELAQARLSVRSNTSSDWIVRELLSVKKKIEMTKLMINQKRESSKYLQDLVKTKESLILAGIHDEYHQYSLLQDQLAKALADIEFHEKEIDVFKGYLNKLYAQNQLYSNVNSGELGVFDQVKVFVAPIDGVISDVFYGVNEICYKKEEMITIHQLERASINTYFDPEEIKYLEVGDVVSVEFPDKSMTKGIISKFFVSTYAVPSEFQKKYEPTERNIVAEVVPLSKADENSWNSFYKMEVKVQKGRYSIGL